MSRGKCLASSIVRGMLKAVKDSPEHAHLSLHPIGYVRTGKSVKFAAKHQPDERDEEQSVLEILPTEEYRVGLQDLAGFSRIWLIWWFHRNATWRPLVLPPRGPARRRGVFATRSPHRPNPLGMTPVKLQGIKGTTVFLGPCDLIDGTPVFDIKPYVPAYDSFPEESCGWLQEVDDWMKQEPRYEIHLQELARCQIEWLRSEWQIDFLPRVEEILSRDPSPHRTRRIRSKGNQRFEMGCGAWRVWFSVHAWRVEIEEIVAGYPLKLLCGQYAEEIPDCDAQLAFLVRWPGDTAVE